MSAPVGTGRAVAVVVALVALVAATLSGCGERGFASQTPRDIAAAAGESLAALTSVHVVADLPAEGRRLSMDLTLDDDGDCRGSFEIGQGRSDIVSVDGDTWVRADRAFYEPFDPEYGRRTAAIVGDGWVELMLDELTDICELGFLRDELVRELDDPVVPASNGGTEEVDGRETVRLVVSPGGSESSTLLVAVDEPHQVLQVRTTGEAPSELTFSEFDEPVEAQPPPADRIVERPGSGTLFV